MFNRITNTFKTFRVLENFKFNLVGTDLFANAAFDSHIESAKLTSSLLPVAPIFALVVGLPIAPLLMHVYVHRVATSIKLCTLVITVRID